MPSAADVLAGFVIGLAFLALVGAAELWRRFGDPPAEWTRKLVHVGGGIVCTLFPFVIDSHWVVLVLALLMLVLFVAGKKLGLLKGVHGVERKSHGTEYYPLVIYLLFVLAHREPWLYVICVMVLAFSDAAAALIGKRFGRIRYEVEDEHKSLEGSLACLLTTFCIVAGLLLIWPDPAIPAAGVCLLAALLAAALVTAFEAVSLDGGDNLWVPLGTYLVLSRSLTRPSDEIALEIVCLAVMVLSIGICAWRTRAFNVGGTLTFILYAFASWSIGSFDWALPVFLGLIVYAIAIWLAGRPGIYRVRPVLRAMLPPFLLLLAANVVWRDTSWRAAAFGPFLAGCVTVVAQSVWNLLHWQRSEGFLARPPAAIWIALACLAVMVAPLGWRQRTVAWEAWLVVSAVSIAVTLAYGRLAPSVFGNPTSDRSAAGRALLTCTAMLAVFALQAAGRLPAWQLR